MPYFIKKVRMELWDVYVCEANSAWEVESGANEEGQETYLGSSIGVLDGEVMVFGPFASWDEAKNQDCARVDTAKLIAVG